jgi:hypothetical protein
VWGRCWKLDRLQQKPDDSLYIGEETLQTRTGPFAELLSYHATCLWRLYQCTFPGSTTRPQCTPLTCIRTLIAVSRQTRRPRNRVLPRITSLETCGPCRYSLPTAVVGETFSMLSIEIGTERLHLSSTNGKNRAHISFSGLRDSPLFLVPYSMTDGIGLAR